MATGRCQRPGASVPAAVLPTGGVPAGRSARPRCTAPDLGPRMRASPGDPGLTPPSAYLLGKTADCDVGVPVCACAATAMGVPTGTVVKATSIPGSHSGPSSPAERGRPTAQEGAAASRLQGPAGQERWGSRRRSEGQDRLAASALGCVLRQMALGGGASCGPAPAPVGPHAGPGGWMGSPPGGERAPCARRGPEAPSAGTGDSAGQKPVPLPRRHKGSYRNVSVNPSPQPGPGAEKDDPTLSLTAGTDFSCAPRRPRSAHRAGSWKHGSQLAQGPPVPPTPTWKVPSASPTTHAG